MKDDSTGEELTGEEAKDRACLDGLGKKKGKIHLPDSMP